MNIRNIYLGILCLCMTVTQMTAISVHHLTCEYSRNPLGIDMQSPQLSWQLEAEQRGQMQSAYEIRVGTDSTNLVNAKRLVWKSGKIHRSTTLNIQYAGKKLKPFTRYYWMVRSYNQDDVASAWSPIAWFETAMLSPTDWKGVWIGDGSKAPTKTEDFYKDDPTPLFRKKFAVKKKIKEARLYISGLGYYEASLNGRKIGDHILDPGWTNYSKQILYSTYDVTNMIHVGDNCMGVILGNGFYNPLPMRIFKPLRDYLTIGRPCLKAQLRIVYTNGQIQTIYSDESWKTAPGPILKNNVYLGESYDARKEIADWNLPSFSDALWSKASLIIAFPAGTLTAQIQPPIRLRELIHPKRMTETKRGEFVFDMGQNFAGVVRLKVRGPKGTKIKIRYGEDIYSDGSLNVMTSVAGQIKKNWGANRTLPGQPQTAWQEDSYILKGEGEEIWSPRFTFHGFRYVEITGWPGRPSMENIAGLRLSADLESTGKFKCSNPMLNQLFNVLDYTFLSNVFSVQSDCPAREKFGYGGDIVGVSSTFCWFYNMENFYRKAVSDYANDQRPSGGMTETAPFNGIHSLGLGEESGPIGWQLAFSYMQDKLYDYYGDKKTLKEYYPLFKKQVEYIRTQAKDYLIDHGINDHESLEKRIPALFATAHYYHHVLLLTKFAERIGNTADKQTYQLLADNIKKAFIHKFITTGNGIVGNRTEASQAFGLIYDLLPAEEKAMAFEQLVNVIDEQDQHIKTGIFGTPAVLNTLRENNRNDIAYAMATQSDFPGWGYMLKSGATTLWETWKYSDNVYSQNHPMFGSVGEWMFQSLGGLLPLAPGFKEFMIKPQPVPDLKYVNCDYQSVHGLIESHWKQDEKHFILTIKVPVNTKAKVFIPAQETDEITESNQLIKQSKNMQIIGYQAGYFCLEVNSGVYSFVVTKK